MATVNTAFGVLPSPKTQLLGGNAGGGVGSAALQQPRPQQPRPQQGIATGIAPTFAQMQQQGQARPAPQQPPQEAAAAPQQPAMLSQLGSYLGDAGQAGAAPAPAPAYTPIQQRILDQSRRATPQSVALAMEQGYYNQMRPVTVPGTSMKVTPGTVGMYDNQQVVYGADGRMRPYTEADRDAEVMRTVARGDVPGTTEYELRQQMLNDPAYADVLSTVRGMLYSANQQAQQAGQPRQLTSAEQFQNELMQQLRDFGTQGITDTPAMQQLRASRRADIEAEFGAQASALDEEMARRGLSASSIGAGRFGDLAGQQARAITSMEAELQSQAEKEAAENKRFYLQQMMGLSGQLASGEMEKSKLTLQERQINADIDYRAKELQQEAALKGRDLDLQQARDMATTEHQRGQLALGYAEIGSKEKLSGEELSARERMSSAEIGSRERMTQAEIGSREQMQRTGFAFEAGQSALERSLKEKMQTTELTAAEKRQLAGIEADKAAAKDRQAFEAAQSVLERNLREKMQTTELSAAEKRQLAEIEANKAAAAERQKFETKQQEQNQKWQGEQSKLDRDLREMLSGNEIKAAQDRFEKTYKLDLEKFGFEKGQSQNQFLAQLATVLAPMDPKKRDEFLRSIGIKLPGTPAGAVGGTNTGGAYGVDTGI